MILPSAADISAGLGESNDLGFCVDLGGSQQFSLTWEADESGLLLQMSLGEALANHLLARIIDIQVESESSEAGSSENL